MQTLADEVMRIPLAPRFGLSAYLLGGGILVDSGLPWHHRKIRRALEGHEVHRIVLTHAHIDHAGTVSAIATERGCKVLCGSADLADLAAGVSPVVRLGRATRPLQRAVVRYRPVRASALHDGDDVGSGFVAVETRGHTPGHHALWRESDRVLIAGDALFGVGPRLRTGVFTPPAYGQPDREGVRRSVLRLAELRPNLILFGHGPPLTDDPAGELNALAESLY